MSFTPYLGFDGTCAEAMRFYAGLFGADDLQIMTFDQAPPSEGMPPLGDRVLHAQFSRGGQVLMASDSPPGRFAPMQGSAVMHATPTLEEARRLFDALAEGGEVVMPFGPTFWSAGFGMVRDRFGTSWMLSAPGPEGA